MQINPRAGPEDVVGEFSFLVNLSRLLVCVGIARGRCQVRVFLEHPAAIPLQVLLFDLHSSLNQRRHRQTPGARLHLLPMRELRDLRDRKDDMVLAPHDGYHRECWRWRRLNVSPLFGAEHGSVDLQEPRDAHLSY